MSREILDIESFKKEMEDFIAKEAMNPTEFGLLSMNDPRFVFDIRKGRSVRLQTASKILKFMDNYKEAVEQCMCQRCGNKITTH